MNAQRVQMCAVQIQFCGNAAGTPAAGGAAAGACRQPGRCGRMLPGRFARSAGKGRRVLHIQQYQADCAKYTVNLHRETRAK